VIFNPHPHLSPGLRMSGGIIVYPPPPYIFTVRTAASLPFSLFRNCNRRNHKTLEPTACRGVSDFPCKPHSFRKRLRRVFISKGNLSGRWNVLKRSEVSAKWSKCKVKWMRSEGNAKWKKVNSKWSEVYSKWSEVNAKWSKRMRSEVNTKWSEVNANRNEVNVKWSKWMRSGAKWMGSEVNSKWSKWMRSGVKWMPSEVSECKVKWMRSGVKWMRI